MRSASLPCPTAVLARYPGPGGRRRELVLCAGAHGSRLVIDRDACTLCDRRLVAHLAPDEPDCNAQVVCDLYLHDPNRQPCRRLAAEDLRAPAIDAGAFVAADAAVADLGLGSSHATAGDVRTRNGRPVIYENTAYALVAVPGRSARRELRWAWRPADVEEGPWTVLSLRTLVERLESYQPMRATTERALRSAEDSGQSAGQSGAVLARELARLDASPVVLNRGLREAVLAAVGSGRLSMSEIALRCGVLKRDRRGRVSGETSWLARRVGLMSPGGSRATPTCWIHSDVLALIARKGLGVCPREVELG